MSGRLDSNQRPPEPHSAGRFSKRAVFPSLFAISGFQALRILRGLLRLDKDSTALTALLITYVKPAKLDEQLGGLVDVTAHLS